MDAALDQDSANPVKLKIVGMDCGNCALTIEDSIRKVPGVLNAQVSFTTETMEIEGNVGQEVIEQRLKELGYRLATEEDNAAAAATVQDRHGAAGFARFMWQQSALRRALLTAAAVIIGLLLLPGASPVLGQEPLDLLFAAAVVVAGGSVFVKGLRSLIFARRVTIDLLMVIASIGALAIGATGEAVTVILLFMLGEGLEAYSAERARDSLRSLMALQPQEATVLSSHCSGHGHDHGHDHDHSHDHQHDHHTKDASHDHTQVLPVEQVKVGDRVLVRPGQRIPVDGIVLKGISSVNQAPVTGESVPVVKVVDDEVMAGTVNGEAALEIRTSRPSSEGTIARIAKLVEQAQAQRSPAERFIDRFARWYTPAVVVLALLVVGIPVFGFGAPLMNQADGTTGWLYRGLAMLIIACPCALVISIPVTVVSGLSRLANLGVLVKGGAQLDRLAAIEVIAFDKTGTLTHGRPRVTNLATADCSHETAQNDDCNHCDDMVAVAASVERASEHPVAHAILEAARERSGVGHLAVAADVRAHPGQGVSGELDGGRQVRVGTQELFQETMQGWETISPHADTARNNGDTIMYVGADDKVVGYIGVQDKIRDITRETLADLGELGIYRVMLTGDNEGAAQRVAAQAGGVDEVRAGLLPDEKLAAIESLHASHGPVAMVGDGINDAPALARSDVGIAMGGGGTAQAMETADIVLMQDDLSDVPLALHMARKSRRIIKENIALSLGLKVAFLGLAIPGIATLWMAVVADVGATLLVTLNGMRLLRIEK
jgi:Cd2+/Zn2+-exporting ATPase